MFLGIVIFLGVLLLATVVCSAYETWKYLNRK